jgi:SAM-dependent methyltransferase
MITTCRACDSPNVVAVPGIMAPFVAERMLDGNNRTDACECQACGLLWASVQPTDEQLARYYADYWRGDYITQREQHEPGLQERHPYLLAPREGRAVVEAFLGWPAPGSVLDIGGGDGNETPYVGEALVHVLDVAPRQAIANVTHVSEITRAYDLVVLAHVLEHVPDPRGLLNLAVKSCVPNGRIYIELPDEAAAYGKRPRLAEVMRVRGAWHEHINYFDPCSLTVLATVCGITVQRLEQSEWAGGPLFRMVGQVAS